MNSGGQSFGQSFGESCEMAQAAGLRAAPRAANFGSLVSLALVASFVALASVGVGCAGGPDQSITKNNAEPEARILSHVDGDRVLDGVSFDLRGTATDPDDGPESLVARWLLDGAELCPEAPVNLDGTVVCAATLSVADGGRVSLEVRDDDNASALAQVQLEVLASGPPSASISSPVEGVHYYADQLIDVLASVTDPESPPGELSVEWTLGDGTRLSLPGADSSGRIEGSTLLPEGLLTLNLRVSDPQGNVAAESVLVDVGPPNVGPSCFLLAPLPDTVLPLGELLTLRAEVSDPDVGPELLRLSFESDRDGLLDELGPDASGVGVGVAASLSAGTHQITVTCVDERGAEGADSVQIRVAAPPTIDLRTPAIGDLLDAGIPVTFEAAVADAEDDPAALTVQWESDIDGVFNTTSADSSGLLRFSALLSTSPHQVRLTVTDTDGLSASRITTFEVRPCVFYFDQDNDGYGDPANFVETCAQPAGYVADGTDCDDGAATTFPGAPEYCNVEDDDCDGLVDEAGVLDGQLSYLDGDGDGFGASGTVISECALSPGRVGNPLDCDDADLAVSPLGVELCDDGLDQDCDGRDLPCILERDLGLAPLVLYGEVARDEAGAVVAAGGDLDGDGYRDLLVGAPLANTTAIDAGAAYVISGRRRGAQDLSSVDARVVGSTRDDLLGTALLGDFDLNDDGYDDLLVGVPGDDSGLLDSGGLLLFYGPVLGELDRVDADLALTGLSASEAAGAGLGGGRDFNGDGVPDIIVGSTAEDGGGRDAGLVTLLSGASFSAGLSGAIASYEGELSDDQAGASLCSGDLDGDGLRDLLLGAPYEDSGGNAAGAVYLVLGGGTGGRIDLRYADAQLTGQSTTDFAGRSIDCGQDADGDGRHDLLIGAVGDDTVSAGSGAAYLWTHTLSGTRSLSLADTKLLGEAGLDYFGRSVSFAGDVNGDGDADLLIGADGDDAAAVNAGAAYLVLGPVPSGTLGARSLYLRWLGDATDAGAGSAVAGLGDTNGDGVDDVLIGGSKADATGTDAGGAWLWLGGAGL